MTGTVRPNPLRWLLYAYGAGLPPRHKEWVLHDVTAPTWRWRHLARATAQLAPIAVLLYVFIPGEPWVRAMAVLGGLLIGYFYSFAYMYESAEHRAVKAGYPQGGAAAVRDEAHADERREQEERYAARWRQDD
ncbi:DUF5313 domain-containing protein [Pseudonocardia kujensis]|nr:DUF5313 domain-containing protein [Pseudonocardia kujensis]